MRDLEGAPPNPIEVAMLPNGYLDDIFQWHQGVEAEEMGGALVGKSARRGISAANRGKKNGS